MNVSLDRFSAEPTSNILDGSDATRWLINRAVVDPPAVELFLDQRKVLSRLKITPLKSVGFSSIASLVLIEFDDSSATYLQFDCTSDTQPFYLGKLTARFILTILKTCDDVLFDNTGFTEVVAYEGGINDWLIRS